jgi:hypothetical protein
MCCNPNLFYVSYFRFLYNCFLKFIVQKIIFEMFKSGVVILTRRQNANITDADVIVT